MRSLSLTVHIILDLQSLPPDLVRDRSLRAVATEERLPGIRILRWTHWSGHDLSRTINKLHIRFLPNCTDSTFVIRRRFNFPPSATLTNFSRLNDYKKRFSKVKAVAELGIYKSFHPINVSSHRMKNSAPRSNNNRSSESDIATISNRIPYSGLPFHSSLHPHPNFFSHNPVARDAAEYPLDLRWHSSIASRKARKLICIFHLHTDYC